MDQREITEACLNHAKIIHDKKLTGHIQTLFYRKDHTMCAVVEDDKKNIELVLDISKVELAK